MVHGQYPKSEIHNLGRFISVMKFRPLEWRSSHPHVVADRVEDLTSPEAIRLNSKCDRTISLYGYVRGTHLKSNSAAHIPGSDMPLYIVILAALASEQFLLSIKAQLCTCHIVMFRPRYTHVSILPWSAMCGLFVQAVVISP